MGVIRFLRVVREASPQDYSHYRPDTRINKSHIDDPSQVILNTPHPDDPSLNNGATMGNANVLVGLAIGGFVALVILLLLSYLLYKGCREMLSNLRTRFNLKKFRDRDQDSPQTQGSNLSFNGEKDMTPKRRESISLPVSPPLEFQTIRQQTKGVENSSFDDFPENIPPLPVQPPPIYSRPIPQRYTDPPKFRDEEELPKNCPDFYTSSKTLVVGDHRGRQGQAIRGQSTREPSTSGHNYEEERLPTPPPDPPIATSTASSTSGHSRRPSDAVLGRSFSQIPPEEVEQKKRFTSTFYHLMDSVDVEDED